MDAADQGPEGMLSKPNPRVTGKFSIRRPPLVVVVVVVMVMMMVMSVSIHNQAGRTLRNQTMCHLPSFSHAGPELRDVLANPSQGSHNPNIFRLA